MNENDVEFISIKENFDTTTAMGKAMLRVALVFAQLEREQTSERISDVMGHRASLGIYNGGPRPLGYSVVNKELVPYKKEKQLVELIFAKFLETRSTSYTAQFLNENGYRDRNNNGFENQQVQWILQNPVYAGKIRWNGKLYEGLHQPIISEKMFQAVQEIFTSKMWNRPKNSTHALLAKKTFCAVCGSPLTPFFAYNRNKVKYFYYRCTGSKDTNKTCQKPYFSFSELEGSVTEIILSLSEEKHFMPIENKLLKHNEKISIRIAEQKKVLAQIETNLSEIKTKKDRYFDGLLSSQFSSKEREGINARLGEIESEEKQLKNKSFKQQMTITQAEEELVNITEIKKQFIGYRSNHPFADEQTHRIYLATILDRIHCAKESLQIQFSMLPWKETFPMSP